MHDIVIEILVVLVAVCVSVFTRYLIPYIKTITNQNKYAELVDIIETAVTAAEQTMNQPKQGKAKKADVLAFVSHWLAEKNINISEDELNRLIESAVFAMNQEY